MTLQKSSGIASSSQTLDVMLFKLPASTTPIPSALYTSPGILRHFQNQYIYCPSISFQGNLSPSFCCCSFARPVRRLRHIQFVQCCFTSTETVRTVRDGETRTSTSTFTQPLSPVSDCSSSLLLYVHRDRTNC